MALGAPDPGLDESWSTEQLLGVALGRGLGVLTQIYEWSGCMSWVSLLAATVVISCAAVFLSSFIKTLWRGGENRGLCHCWYAVAIDLWQSRPFTENEARLFWGDTRVARAVLFVAFVGMALAVVWVAGLRRSMLWLVAAYAVLQDQSVKRLALMRLLRSRYGGGFG